MVMIQALLLLDNNVVFYYLGNRLTDPLTYWKIFGIYNYGYGTALLSKHE